MSKMEMFFWGWPKKSLNECFLKLLGRGCLVFLNQHWDFIPIKMGGGQENFSWHFGVRGREVKDIT